MMGLLTGCRNSRQRDLEQTKFDLNDLETEATRLQDVMALYHSIINCVMEIVVLNNEESVLFDNLRTAVAGLKENKDILDQKKYDD